MHETVERKAARERFEKWGRTQANFNMERDFMNQGGGYKWRHVNVAWQAWWAALQPAQEGATTDAAWLATHRSGRVQHFNSAEGWVVHQITGDTSVGAAAAMMADFVRAARS